MIADRPEYHKNHVLKVSEESQIALLGGEWQFLKIRSNFIPATKIKGQWPIKHIDFQQQDEKMCEEKKIMRTTSKKLMYEFQYV